VIGDGIDQHSPKNIQRRILQQHDGLGVDDTAIADHRQSLIDR
jgi:hypothetical protein